MQVILDDEHPSPSVVRFFGALGATVRAARAEGRLGAVEVHVGGSAADGILEDRIRASLGSGVDTLERVGTVDGGPVACANRMAQGATVDGLLFVDAAAYPSPRLLPELLRALDDDEVGIVEARRIPMGPPKGFDEQTGDTSWVARDCLLTRRVVFERVGGFDAEHFEPVTAAVDLAWRVRAAGHRVVCAPLAVIFRETLAAVHGSSGTGAARGPVALGAILLAHRYGGPEAVEAAVAQLENEDDDDSRRAVAAYRSRVEEGKVPGVVMGVPAGVFERLDILDLLAES